MNQKLLVIGLGYLFSYTTIIAMRYDIERAREVDWSHQQYKEDLLALKKNLLYGCTSLVALATSAPFLRPQIDLDCQKQSCFIENGKIVTVAASSIGSGVFFGKSLYYLIQVVSYKYFVT